MPCIFFSFLKVNKYGKKLNRGKCCFAEISSEATKCYLRWMVWTVLSEYPCLGLAWHLMFTQNWHTMLYPYYQTSLVISMCMACVFSYKMPPTPFEPFHLIIITFRLFNLINSTFCSSEVGKLSTQFVEGGQVMSPV